MLDAGIGNEYIPDHIFLTHGHGDHSKNLPLSFINLCNYKFKMSEEAIQNKKNKQIKLKKCINTSDLLMQEGVQRKTNIYVPIEIEQYVRDYIHSFYVLSKNNPNHKAHNKYNLIPVKPEEKFSIIIRNKKWQIEIIQCYHTVPCRGYGFSEVRRKLKDEYVGFPREELIKLRKQNIEIEREVTVPVFCYLGDTTEKVFINESVKNYPIIMIECTFLFPDQLENAKNKKHVHIENLESFIKQMDKTTFILYHFSDRYENDEIKDFFKEKNYDNVKVWI